MLHLFALLFQSLGRLVGLGPRKAVSQPAPGSRPAAPEGASGGAARLQTEDGSFVDATRGRSVPYRLYRPVDHAGPAPVVLFSHGLGGSRAGAPYLGRALAEAGYWGVFLQHHGSDAKLFAEAETGFAIREALLDSLLDPNNMVNRFLDIPFVVDELERLSIEPGPFQGLFDLSPGVGMIGHSYGARTVLAAAGQLMGPLAADFKDARITAGVALSPSGGRGIGEDEVIPDEHYAGVDIPLLHITGTEDKPPLSDAPFDPYIRTLPFQKIPAAEQYLVVFEEADHEVFSGMTREMRRGSQPAPDSRVTVTTAEMACLFFDAYLKGSDSAWTNLRTRVSEYLEKGDYYEYR